MILKKERLIMDSKNNENTEQGHVKIRTYITGFILAVVLTAISFSCVLFEGISPLIAAAGLIVFAVVQMLVHLHYFLHLDRTSTMRWNVLALSFTAILLIIFIGGTIWVMYTLNSRMM
jgi:cytochrome o ubiquinol oxidase operon protein cyoD